MKRETSTSRVAGMVMGTRPGSTIPWPGRERRVHVCTPAEGIHVYVNNWTTDILVSKLEMSQMVMRMLRTKTADVCDMSSWASHDVRTFSYRRQAVYCVIYHVISEISCDATSILWCHTVEYMWAFHILLHQMPWSVFWESPAARLTSLQCHNECPCGITNCSVML